MTHVVQNKRKLQGIKNGLALRKALNLDALDTIIVLKKSDRIEFKLPHTVENISYSFVMGLFSKSFQKFNNESDFLHHYYSIEDWFLSHTHKYYKTQSASRISAKSKKARAQLLTPAQRKIAAHNAAVVRWNKPRVQNTDKINSVFAQLQRNADYIRDSAEVLKNTGESCHGEAIRVLQKEAVKRYKKVEDFATRYDVSVKVMMKAGE